MSVWIQDGEAYCFFCGPCDTLMTHSCTVDALQDRIAELIHEKEESEKIEDDA